MQFRILIAATWFALLNLNAQNHERNQLCLKCHGEVFYLHENTMLERMERKLMNPYYHLDSTAMYLSVHRSFACTDCHAPEYETFPHDNTLRDEPQYACMDCHGGDETFAKFNFEGIESAFRQSVHFDEENERFNCWMCHNPHGYQLALREKQSISEVVALSNQMCMQCHNDRFRFGLVSDTLMPNMAKAHTFLPNAGKHMDKVRCLDCHTHAQSDIAVAHQILPKESSVKDCVACHSKNSVLMESLYRFKAEENRKKAGFFNAAILNEGYVIGANRNEILNLLSVVIFGLTLTGILIHGILRILTAKKRKS